MPQGDLHYARATLRHAGQDVTVDNPLPVQGIGGSASDPMPVDVQVVTDANWSVGMPTTDLDVVGTQTVNGAALDISGNSAVWVHIRIDSTGAPTDIRVLPQFSLNGADPWWDFEEGLWASLYWEDTDTANGINKAFLLPCGGQDFLRFRVIGTGIAAGATWEIEINVRGFRGNLAGAHA